MRILLILTTAVLLHAADFRAGVAKADLDPPTGLPMAGYSTRYSKGTLDPLEARVLALSDGSRTIALVTLDLCYTFDPPVMEEIRRAVRGSRRPPRMPSRVPRARRATPGRTVGAPARHPRDRQPIGPT